MASLLTTIATLGGAFVALIVIGLLVLKFYTLAPKERSFIRTGVGGEKVVMNGGAFVVPGIHKVLWVNMKTLKLDVSRGQKDSLITGDKMRVDVRAEFFVRVKADAQSVATAGQTLGEMTLEASALRSQVEAKFVDALRAVAATMGMHELHEKRAEFVQAVQRSVTEDLAKNGLELESVSLTALNQTDKEFFDPNNAFDAEGLAQLTRQTEARRKDINAVTQDTKVAIAEKDLQTTQQTLTLRRTQSEAELRNEQDIATMTANQRAEVARVEAEGRQRAETAQLEANRQIQETRISTERSVETAQISKVTAIQLAGQEQNITVANKSREEAAASAEASTARALAVAAEEKVATARDVEIANRSKAVALVKADEKAREESIGITVAAEAEQVAAGSLATAARARAEGERDAAVARAEGTKAEGEAVAQALRAKNEAQNLLSPELIAQQIKLALLQALPAIIEKSVEPLKNIDSIRIAEVGGLAGAGGPGSSASAANGGLGNEMVSAALKYRTAQPLVDGLLAEVGLKSGGDVNALLSSAASLAGVAVGTDSGPVRPEQGH